MTNYNEIPQRFHVYDASDKAREFVRNSFAMDSLFSGVWPSQWSRKLFLEMIEGRRG